MMMYYETTSDKTIPKSNNGYHTMSANFTKSLATNNYQVSKIDSTNGLLSFIELVANRLSIF
jgi:hypothetical protein